MRTRWISLIFLLAFISLAGCGPAPSEVGGPPYPFKPYMQEAPSQEPASSSSASTALPQLPAPTVGSVVITNTTATPFSSANSASALTPDTAFQDLTQQAREDLAKRLNMNVNQIDLLKIVPAKWPYDSLGCPQADTNNADVPGYQILLTANDQEYAYHTDGKELIGLCNVKPPDEIRTLP